MREKFNYKMFLRKYFWNAVRLEALLKSILVTFLTTQIDDIRSFMVLLSNIVITRESYKYVCLLVGLLMVLIFAKNSRIKEQEILKVLN